MKKASFISHTMHKGKGLRTLTEVDAKFKINIGFSGKLQVNEENRHALMLTIKKPASSSEAGFSSGGFPGLPDYSLFRPVLVEPGDNVLENFLAVCFI